MDQTETIQPEITATPVAWPLPGPLIGRRCERAVVTAYRDLRDHGTQDLEAFRACTTLYRIHHPEASMSEARALVAEWIEHHIVRADAGRTHGCECD